MCKWKVKEMKSQQIIVGYRLSFISYLRIFATIVIVTSHAWSTLPENPETFSLKKSEMMFLEIAYNLTKWAVPVFFMITGALLLRPDKKVGIKDCVCKYAKRMILALLIFGAPYAMLMILFDTKTLSFSIITESLIRVINGDSFGHLWYLYTLIGIYLLLPLFKVFVERSSRQTIEYTLVVLFLFNFVFPFIDALTGVKIAFELPITTYPILYILMGYYAVYVNPRFVEKRWIVVGGITISSFVIILTGLTGSSLRSVMSYSSPVAFVFAVSMFAAFMCVKTESTEHLWKVDRLCFGVYLIHPLFIQFVYKFLHIIPTGSSLFPMWSFVFAAVFVILSFFASWVMSLIKPLKKYVL